MRLSLVFLVVLVFLPVAALSQKRIALSFDDVPRRAGGFLTPEERSAQLIAALERAGVEQAGFSSRRAILRNPMGLVVRSALLPTLRRGT